MKYIKKGKEPISLKRWKKATPNYQKKSWAELPAGISTEIRNSLNVEQGYICCYCGIRISLQNSHTEHFKPLADKKFPKLKFDYRTNLLASCESGTTLETEHGHKFEHCGQRKGDWYSNSQLVSPLTHSCETYFTYSSNGEIQPAINTTKAKIAKSTIKHLGLDIDSLNRHRKAAIDGALPDPEQLEKLGTTKAKQDVAKRIREFKKLDKNGKFTPFCTAIISVLSKYL
jgi:uncharacterized protein (TIGR02646 family)